MSILKDITRFFSNKEVAIIFIYLVAMAMIPGIGNVAAVHLILIALVKKKEWYFKSLMYFGLLKHLNPIFNPPSTNLFLLFVIILFIIFLVHVLSREKIQLFSLEKKFYLLLLIFTVTSMFGSFYLEFSLIRISIVWVFIFVVFQSIRRIGNFDLFRFIIQIAMIIIIASSPLIFMGIGYLGDTGFFKGIINHSQDFALILLPLLMIYILALFNRKIDSSFYHWIIFLLGFTELTLSASRAAVGAFVISFIVYLLLRQKRKLHIKTLIATLVFLAGSIFFISMHQEKFIQKLTSFALKYDNLGAQNFTSKMIETRLSLLEISIKNFINYPLTGIGFNVQIEYLDQMVILHLDELIKYVPGTHIMYSRPLEKGNLYTSVLEENGLFAGIYFVYILLYVFWILYRSGLPWLWVPFLSMILNFMGEASLFSPSGAGNFQMLILVSFYIIALQMKVERRRNDV